MKKVLLLVTTLVCFGVSGQRQKLLKIPLVAQEQPQWCWAASMQMVLNFYNPSNPITQTELAIKNANLKMAKEVPPIEIDLSYVNSNLLGYKSTCTSGTWNIFRVSRSTITDQKKRLISSSFTSSISSYKGTEETQAFDNLFSNLGYDSIQDSKRKSWEDIQKEIDKCRPVILMDGISTYGTHVTVVIGYIERIVNGRLKTFLAIRNPQRESVCGVGESSLISPDYYSPTSGRTLHSVVRHIIPPNRQECATNENCNIDNDQSFDFLERILSGHDIDSHDLARGFGVDIYYISDLKLMKKNLSNKTLLNNISNSSLTSKILQENSSVLRIKKEVVYLYDKINQELILTQLRKDSTNNYNNRIVDLNSKKLQLVTSRRLQNDVRFDYVDYLKFNYRFFRFSYEGRWYLSPFSSYSINKKIFVQDKAYSELKILKALQIETLKDNKQYL